MAIKRLLWLIIFFSLIPASILVVRRIQSEAARPTVTLLMDEIALREQADVLGISSLELAKRYQALGLNGIALYEDTLASLANRGDISALSGATLRSNSFALDLKLRQELEAVPTNGLLISEVKPGALKNALLKNSPAPKMLSLAGQTWYVYPNFDNTRPAGPNLEIIGVWKEAGFDIAYRPRNSIGLKVVGNDFPQEARYLIHAGLQVTGYPNKLPELIAASQPYLTGVIEGTVQDGMEELSNTLPSTKLLSFNQDYINRKLYPEDLIDKYLLAAEERGIRILYLRPYTEEQLGDMFKNTEQLVSGLVARLKNAGYDIGTLPDISLNYRTHALLRGLSSLGAISGLILLTLLYPGSWGASVAGAVLLLSFYAGRFDWDTLALITALVFPILGFGLFREGLSSLGLATLISMVGAILLSAIGSDQEAMLSLRPFAGVGATLIIPPLLYMFHYALRYRRPAKWVRSLWNQTLSLGSVFIFLIGAAAVALILIRRGNFPIVGASTAELALRSLLSDYFVRPRFKEMIGHPMAVLALMNPRWASWIRAALMTGAVVAQATVLNSFSHYHTPLLMSLQRTLTALILGTILGLILLPFSRFLVRLTKRWLESGN
jgi:Family of unknown function (DUF5693)